MQAAGLLHGDLRIPCWRKGVQRSCRVSEEPEGVEVGAPDLVRLDHLIGPRLAQAQRPVAVAALLGRLAVDHRPLVQTEAPQVGGPCGRRGQQFCDEPHHCRPGGQEAFEIKGSGAIGIPVEPPSGALNGTFEGDPGTWVPAAELGRAVHVVREQEVLDRVLGARPAAGSGGRR